VRRFQKIDVNEPTVEDAIAILKGLKPYSRSTTSSATPTTRSRRGRAVGALHPRPQAARQGDRRDRRGRRGADAGAAVASARRPSASRRSRPRSRPWRGSRPRACRRTTRGARSISSSDLKRVVFGQDKAIEALAAAIKLARAGLREPEKPIGSYLFSGPTGVGKTEVARQLASIMGVELIASTCRNIWSATRSRG
jgi:ATP-dependent Clp protease ATP-binding subunit ClpA